MTPSLGVLGFGYIGTVAAACLAHKGPNVIGVDLRAAKVVAMEAGKQSYGRASGR